MHRTDPPPQSHPRELESISQLSNGLDPPRKQNCSALEFCGIASRSTSEKEKEKPDSENESEVL